MLVNIISADSVLYQGDFLSIILPALGGEISVLPRHAPLITPLKEGKITVKDSAKKEFFFEIDRGIIEINYRCVNILVTLKK